MLCSSAISFSRLRQVMSNNEAVMVEALEKSSLDPVSIQQELLHRILEHNLSSEYLNKHLLQQQQQQQQEQEQQQKQNDLVQAFKKYVPVIQYEDIYEEIQRIADGEEGPILGVDPVVDMFTSSGTSGGEHKLFPKTARDYGVSKNSFHLASAILNRDIPGLDKGKALYFQFVRKPGKTRGGLPCYPALTGYYNSSEFKNRPYDPSNDLTSPMEVILCADSLQACYCHLLCGLIHSSQVLKLGSFFASAFVRSIRRLEEWWKDLCRDIRTGTLSDMISDPSLRESVGRLLAAPNPVLAASIEQAFTSTRSLKGIIRSLWPNAKVIDTVITGSMQQYIDVIDHLSGGLPIASCLYASSEAYLGVNLRPLCHPLDISYMLLPEICYYEFLPVEVPESEQLLQNFAVDMSSVELGQEYELVITTQGGLYRYRMGDVLKVTGFQNKAPLFSFVCRKSVLLSIDSDKTGERELHESVTAAVKFLKLKHEGVRLVDYSSFAELSTNPPHYVIFWELEDEFPAEAPLLEEACSKMEESLSVVYRRGRAEKSIGPLELRLVESGTFEEIANYTASQGGSIAQFKMPRCIKNPAHMEILASKLRQSFRSPGPPKYP